MTHQLVVSSFNYEALDPETQHFVRSRANAILTRLRKVAADVVAIGRTLSEVKEKLDHGQWEDWVQTELDMDTATAWRHISAYQAFKSCNLQALDVRPSALYELASPSTPEAARTRALARAEAGERITLRLAREIIGQVKSEENRTKIIIHSTPVDPSPEPSRIRIARKGDDTSTQPALSEEVPPPPAAVEKPRLPISRDRLVERPTRSRADVIEDELIDATPNDDAERLQAGEVLSDGRSMTEKEWDEEPDEYLGECTKGCYGPRWMTKGSSPQFGVHGVYICTGCGYAYPPFCAPNPVTQSRDDIMNVFAESSEDHDEERDEEDDEGRHHQLGSVDPRTAQAISDQYIENALQATGATIVCVG